MYVVFTVLYTLFYYRHIILLLPYVCCACIVCFTAFYAYLLLVFSLEIIVLTVIRTRMFKTIWTAVVVRPLPARTATTGPEGVLHRHLCG